MPATGTTGGYLSGWVRQDPRHGQLSLRLKTRALLMPAGFSHTFGDRTFTLLFDPVVVLSSPENAFVYFATALAGIDPADAGVIASQMVRFALERVTVGGCVQFGIVLSAFLETVYVMEPEVGPPAVQASLDALDEMLMDHMYRMFESSWGPSAGDGLSEDEVAALEKQRFTGEEEEEEAPSCSVCLEEYREGDVITALSSSCSHKFHNVCIVKWLRMKTTCPVCRAPVTGGRQAAE